MRYVGNPDNPVELEQDTQGKPDWIIVPFARLAVRL